MGGCCGATNLIRMAGLFGILAIVFVTVGFATDYWVEKRVDRDSLDDIYKGLSNTHQGIARFYHKRHRGLIKECYPTSSSKTFIAAADNVVDNKCFYIDFSDAKDTSMSTDYKTRMNLLRACLATYVLGMVAVVIALFIGMILCCLKRAQVSFIASIISFMGGVLVLVAIVLFHATEYIDTNDSGAHGEMVFENQWNEKLRVATDSELGYSYALAWVGVILAVLNGVIYLFAAKALARREKGKDTDSLSSSSSIRKAFSRKAPRFSQRSNAYDNPGMMMPVGYPLPPMFLDGHPYEVQGLPAMPALNYGHSVYRVPENESNGF